MFCRTTNNWRGRPLLTSWIVVRLIGSVTTEQGLRVRVAMDNEDLRSGHKVSDTEVADLSIARDAFHGEWNYCIHPRTNQ